MRPSNNSKIKPTPVKSREPLTVSGRQLARWRNWAKREGMAAGIPVQEVDWLLQTTADVDSLSLRLESFQGRSQIASNHSLADLTQLWQKRLRDRVPVQYLAGVTPWRNFSLQVSPAVLIPRPETELLIDIVRKALSASPISGLESGHWLDLGTGSGAIAIGLAGALPGATIHAVDRSSESLAVAQHNAEALGLKERIHFYQGSWWVPLGALKGQVSGMVSNPPYIPTDAIPHLQPEVVRHEPHLALDGGRDGLEHIRHLVEVAPDYLRPGGTWAIEMMAGQGEAVAQMLAARGHYDNIQILPDLAGVDRFALANRR